MTDQETRSGYVAAFVRERFFRNTALYYALNEDDAEEALQDAAAYALRKMPVDTERHARAWFCICVKHNCFRYNRGPTNSKVASEVVADHQSESVRFGCDDESLVERVEANVEVRNLLEALCDLRPEQRDTILDVAVGGSSYREVMTARGWTYTKVNRCMAEGRNALRSRLALAGG